MISRITLLQICSNNDRSEKKISSQKRENISIYLQENSPYLTVCLNKFNFPVIPYKRKLFDFKQKKKKKMRELNVWFIIIPINIWLDSTNNFVNSKKFY